MTKFYKRITDNIHGTISFEKEFIWNLTTTKEFTRLSRIRQLGLVNFVFPTSTHSRLEHSLGVYEIARKAINFLQPKDELLNKAILAAALLHDIGHGPMSHLFESISEIDHEEYSIQIILDKKTEINNILSKEDKKLPEMVASILNKKNKNKWAVSLISSEVDVDRMDYLVRDASMCGISSKIVNIDYLISKMNIIDNKLVFSNSALRELETFIFSRYKMYETVYYNPKNLSFQKVFDFFFNRLRYLSNNNYVFEFLRKEDFKFLLDSKKLETSKFLELDDFVIWNLIKEMNKEKDLLLKKITTHLLTGRQPKISKTRKNIKGIEFQSWQFITISHDLKSYGSNQKERALVLDEKEQISYLDDLSLIVSSALNSLEKVKESTFMVEV